MIKQYVRGFDIDKFKPETLEHLYNKLLTIFWNCKYRITADLIPLQKDIPPIKGVSIEFCDNDCCISHFGYNFYIRTKQAVKGKRYKTFKIALRELQKLANKYGYKIEQLYIRNCHFNRRYIINL